MSFIDLRGLDWYKKRVAVIPPAPLCYPPLGCLNVAGSSLEGRGPRSCMQVILNQLRELVLGSLPTAFFFLILLAAYHALVRKPLEKVLADRHGRTGGAMDDAKAAIAAAEGKTTEYETRLRDARAEIFNARAARQKAASDARDKALAEARAAAPASHWRRTRGSRTLWSRGEGRA